MFKAKELPTISFVTPNYNDADTIERMVESIMDQDYPALEQIIVDDGSTDNSKEVLNKLQEKYKDRLKVIFLDHNQGACIARNIGAKEAKGKYLSFLPADAVLYPGMARIWVDILENNPEYDFAYGGYKFVDEQGHEIYSYMSDNFDPYFLKVTNYIDGSFPLKKELFDKMGGWDPTIKSLQDWDFWLNAVINHGAKGFFSQQLFFETTMPHAGGLSDDSHRNWIERTTAIKSKYGIPQSKICVTGQGASFHAKNVAKILGADYLPNPSFKENKYEMIYIIGFFGNVGESLVRTNALRVLHWIGSDILQLQQADPKVREETVAWIDNNIDINLCEIEATQKELAELGIKARIVPFPPRNLFEPMPLPEKFSIACYQPYNNSSFYYPDFITSVAAKLPNVDFYFFGDGSKHGKVDNITHMGVLNKDEIKDLVAKTSMILRITHHDGLPLSVVEWITAGRNAITSIDIPFSNYFKIDTLNKKDPTKKEMDVIVDRNEKKLLKLIEKVKIQKLNVEGSKFYNDLCNEEIFNKNIKQFLELDIKEWWRVMSPLWPKMESNQESSDDIATIIKEVKALKAENVIDMGCGTGRWGDLLPVDDYTGVDFSQELIDLAAERHPEHQFICKDIREYEPGKKFDLAFSFASLLHVKPAEMEEYVKAIKKIANRAVFVEPVKEAPTGGGNRQIHPEIIKLQKETDFVFNIKYTWVHDYMKYFNVIKVVPMSHNRNLFVVEL